jgi:hypothetical protein
MQIQVKAKEIRLDQPHGMNTYHGGDASDDSSAGPCSWRCGGWRRQESGTEERGEGEEEGEGERWRRPGRTWQPHARHLEGEHEQAGRDAAQGGDFFLPGRKEGFAGLVALRLVPLCRWLSVDDESRTLHSCYYLFNFKYQALV